MQLEDFKVLDVRPLTVSDVADVAGRLAVEPASTWAVVDVESLGKGTRDDGLIVMRFEHHIFRDQSGRGAPGGHPNSYQTLLDAMKIDEDAALRSASWGMFQIMGFNCVPAGHGTARGMIQDMLSGERRQLDLFAAFVSHHKTMHAALKRRDWATFARLYNGTGYRVNRYDEKLAERYEARRGWLLGGGLSRLLRTGTEGDDVRELQRMLNRIGGLPFPLEESGRFDAGTLEHVIDFQKTRGLDADGIVGPKTWARLKELAS